MPFISSAATSPIGFDSNAFAAKLSDFTNFDPKSTHVWNDQQNHPFSTVFVMAGSEYRAIEPTLDPIAIQLTADDRKIITGQLNALETAINDDAELSDELKAESTENLDALINEINTAPTMAGVDVSLQIDHIRNNQEDDHCGLKVRLIWSASLAVWFPIELDADFTWATSMVQFPTVLISLFRPTGYGQLFKMALSLSKPVKLLASTAIAAGMVLWNTAVAKILDYADDGGRLYFPAVAYQLLNRLFASLTPAPDHSASGAVATPDLAAIGQLWQARYEQLSVLDRNWFRTDTYDIKLTVPYGSDTVDNYYRTFLPDLAWLPGGTIVTFKTSVLDAEGFTAGTMLFDDNLQLQMVAAITQTGDNVRREGPPTWRVDPQTPNEGIVNAFVSTYFSGDAMTADKLAATNNQRDQNRYAYVAQVMNQVMNSYANHLRAVSASADLSNTGLPQFPSLTIVNQNQYDFGQRPFVAIAPSNRAVEVHLNDSSALFRDVLGTSPHIATTSYGGEYQQGQDPTLGLMPDGATVLEIHGGNGNNQLFYNVGTLRSDGTLSFPSNGTSYDMGEDPCLAVANKDGAERILEVHRSESGTSKNLYYNIATRSGTTITWPSQGTQYAEGITPFVTFAPDQDSVLVAHDDSSHIKVKTGNFKSSGKIDWIYSYSVMPGVEPAIAVDSDNRVILIAREPNSSNLVYALGQFYIDGNYRGVHWTVAGVRLSIGRYPCLARIGGGQVLLANENLANPIGMIGTTLSVAVPAGFYD